VLLKNRCFLKQVLLKKSNCLGVKVLVKVMRSKPGASVQMGANFSVSFAVQRAGTVRTARIALGVARMIDRQNDKAGIRQGGSGVMMTAEPSPPAMRNHDERELVSRDRAAVHCEESSAAAGIDLLR
jgi:hypothetical protein